MRTQMHSRTCLVLVMLVALVVPVRGQTETAVLSGRVVDAQGAAIAGAHVALTNIDTNTPAAVDTNAEGLYVFPSLRPGRYRVVVTKGGFKQGVRSEIVLHVQDSLTQNFTLQVGSVSESVTVTAQADLISTEPAVSTVVDRQFVENLPLNGRSFQALIELTPGVVLTPSTNFSLGQFSVDGQRPSSNYYMVDGVAANIGIIAGSPGQSAAGTAAGLSVQGGTNSLVSVDAMQEFRIQTSTYAPEFGRAPGAQISIVTRSGTNAFHGAVFEYFRNDVLDANNWFNNQAGAKKSAERQNDFGGVLSGPIIKNRTFFFFSYEGLRLRQPQFVKTCVPSAFARAQASPAVLPFLNAYPLANIDQTLTGGPFGNCPPNPSPPFPPGVPNFLAELDAGFSDPSTLNATSIRVDHQVNSKLTLFGRYDYAPSNTHQRGGAGVATLSSVAFTRLRTQTATLGSTWILTPSVTNDLRFNFSNNALLNRFDLDTFQGAVVPPDSILFPAGFDHKQSVFLLDLLDANQYFQGKVTESRQRQINLVDSLSWIRGAHALRFGVDYRRLSPNFSPPPYFQFNESLGAFAASGISVASFVVANRSATLFFHNVGAYAQDTWKTNSKLTLTFGVRWDVDPAPSVGNGLNLLAVTGFGNLSTLALAPPGTALWNTTYGNFAPRIGVAYQLRQSAGWGTVLRGGYGVFYDLADQQVGDAVNALQYPFSVDNILFSPSGVPFPLPAAQQLPPPFTPQPNPLTNLVAFDPHMKLPYSHEWNFGVEQSLGQVQALTLSYVGQAGRRLLLQQVILGPTNLIGPLGQENLVQNSATSNYNALQLQFQRRLSHGLQALASYTYSHSIDDGSGAAFDSPNLLAQGVAPQSNRGPSDFDIRHSFTAAFTYDIPSPKDTGALKTVLGGWAIDSDTRARSAAPVTPFFGGFVFGPNNVLQIRPDVVPGMPLYLTGPQFPGGKALNAAAFVPPPGGPTPTRQGDLGRNGLRGFGATQLDFTVHRQFDVREWFHLQFRAEFFNILNHPNFGSPQPDLTKPFFGQATQMLATSLGQGMAGTGSFSPLYAIGGPRSIQLALKLMF